MTVAGTTDGAAGEIETEMIVGTAIATTEAKPVY